MNRSYTKGLYIGLLIVTVVSLLIFFAVDWNKDTELSPINKLRLDSSKAYEDLQQISEKSGINNISNATALQTDGLAVTVIDLYGSIVYSTEANIDSDLLLAEALYMDDAYKNGNEHRYKLAQPLYYEDKITGFAIFEKIYVYNENEFSYKYILLGIAVVSLILLTIIQGKTVFAEYPAELVEIQNALLDITKGIYNPLKVKSDSQHLNLYHSYNMLIDELKFTMEKREITDRNHKAFINKISHELKTPIATINAYIEALKSNLASNEEKRQNYIDVIDKKVHQLTDLINNFFAYTQEDASQFKYNFEECYINDVIDEIFHNINGQKDERTTCKNLLPRCIVNIDKIRLEQVVINLYDNAKKHTSTDDTISFLSYREDDSIVIEVNDSGEGISAEELPYIFDSYYQGNRSRRIDYQGVGLGLSICKSIIDAHNGSIRVKSQQGIGTIMYVYIPII